ncbi:MAG: mechanosensitive ion channel family protein [Proteobacteria bacterium]|nr:mechanosensitive ion channel family protein [Pseudomonadota bacterium]
MSRTLLVAALVWLTSLTALHAQTTAAPPAGLSQEQFNSLVDAISNSVTEKLKAQGTVVAPEAKPDAKPEPKSEPKPAPSASKGGKPPPGPKVIITAPKEGPNAFAVFIEDAGRVLAAVPVMLGKLGSIPSLLDQGGPGNRGAGTYLLLLGAVIVVAVAAEAALRGLLAPLRRRLLAAAPASFGSRSFASLGGLIALDALGVAAVWGVCEGATGVWFNGANGQDRLAAAALMAIWHWRLAVLAFRVVLQPDAPLARLCDAGDHEARVMYRRVSVVMLLMSFGTLLGVVLRNIGTPPDAVAAYQVCGSLLYLAAFLWMAYGSRPAAQQWFGGLGKIAPAVGWVGPAWIPVAPLFLAALVATTIFGAVSGKLHVGQAMVLTLNLVVAVLLFETLMQAVVRRLDSQLEGATAASPYPKLPDVVARCVRVAVLIAVAVAIAESWVVQVLGLVNESEWDQLTRSSRTAAFTLFVGFVAWELFKYATEPYMEHKNKNAADAIADGDAAGPPASRISTMMPLLRRTVAVLIGLVAVMIALEDFGVNITPLIAGASVFGIAISFGSQTLVKDIVSGIFYLSDDAFRVGEYIDCGKAKGTVEGFTLRSIKLRHQNGQVHTVPFGQLGQITNFSRDWITVKFNLRFARDTDIEKLRKASKKIGAEIAELPQFKDEILAPFKMQGVADIVENALLIRFKFTARPGNPAAIQREAVKRMFSTLPGMGIEFAKEGAAVVLQTVSSGDGSSAPPAPAPEPAKAAS